MLFTRCLYSYELLWVENTKSVGQTVDNHSEDNVATKHNLAQKDIDFLKASWANLAELEANPVTQEDHLDLQVISLVIEKVNQQVASPKNMQLLINTIVDDE